MESIFETYKRRLCKICKNKNTNLCNIVFNINGEVQCCYYDRNIKKEGYKQFKYPTANKEKPIMKGIDK